MKKRQQQEIVVSGLAINTTSDISSQEEEDNTNEDYQFLVQSSKAQADHSTGILMSLVEPSVRKIGGGGAVSMSAFQVYLFDLFFANYAAAVETKPLLC